MYISLRRNKQRSLWDSRTNETEVVVKSGWGLGGLYKGVDWNDEHGGCDACNVASLQTCQN